MWLDGHRADPRRPSPTRADPRRPPPTRPTCGDQRNSHQTGPTGRRVGLPKAGRLVSRRTRNRSKPLICRHIAVRPQFAAGRLTTWSISDDCPTRCAF